jgi:hypothetical protein
MPSVYTRSVAFTVTNVVFPDAGVGVYAVQDTVPGGWNVSNISDDGTLNNTGNTVEWGPFFDGLARSLTYQVTPPTNAVGAGDFSGVAEFDGTNEVAISGRRTVVSSSSTNTIVCAMPATFVPDAPFAVTNNVTVAVGISAYAVEDTLPAGWSVTNISDGGVFDSNSGVVLWGPFSDGISRALSYTTVPPSNANVVVTLEGEGDFDGTSASITGQRQLTPSVSVPGTAISVIPTQFTPGQWLTVSNVVTPGANAGVFAVQDQPPTGWVVGNVSAGGSFDAGNNLVKWGPFFPNGAVTLTYNVTPPASASGTAQFVGAVSFGGVNVAIGGQRSSSALQVFYGSTVSSLPANFSTGVAFTVTNTVTPGSGTTLYGVADTPPSGWVVSHVSDSGAFDPLSGQVKWGPFFDASSRTLTYEVTPGAFPSTAGFFGEAVFNNITIPIAGERQTIEVVTGSGTVISSLAPAFTPGIAFTVTNVATPAPGVSTYAVQDIVPKGWTVNNINDGGTFAAGASTVEWGPFFDDFPRTLTYSVVPSFLTNTAVFNGTALFDTNTVLVTGERESSPPLLDPPVVAQVNGRSAPISITSGAGGAVQLAVTATNAVPVQLSYRWTSSGGGQLADGTNSDGSVYYGTTAATLIISNIFRAEAGSYSVIVSDAQAGYSGSATNLAAAVTVVEPVITKQLSNAQFSQGSVGSLAFGVVGTPAIEYRWFQVLPQSTNVLSDGALGGGGAISGSATGTLSFSPVEDADAGSYSVIASNTYGSVTSALVTVTVVDAPTIENILVSSTAGYNAGSSASLTVVASNAASAPLSYQWSLNGRTLIDTTNPDGSSFKGTTTSNLTVNNLLGAESGNYAVQVRNTAPGATGSSSGIVSIQVSDPVIIQNPFSAQVKQGAQVSFMGGAYGSFPMSLQWYQGGIPVPLGSLGTLSFTATDAAAGNYVLIASNAYGTATTRTATLTVIDVPTVNISPPAATLNAGGSASFTAVAGASAAIPFTYQWLFNGAPLTDGTRFDGSVISGSSGATLSVSGIFGAESGQYTVVVMDAQANVVGTNSATARLIVNDPAIIQQPANVVTTNGYGASFSVLATGTPPLAYQWNFNGQPIAQATLASLSLNGVTTGQAGSYSVTVSGPGGVIKSGAATLTVLVGTSATISNPAYQSNVLTFLVSGTAGLSYTVQGSTDLTQWVSLATNVSPFVFTDTNSGGLRGRFYRVVFPPH